MTRSGMLALNESNNENTQDPVDVAKHSDMMKDTRHVIPTISKVKIIKLKQNLNM